MDFSVSPRELSQAFRVARNLGEGSEEQITLEARDSTAVVTHHAAKAEIIAMVFESGECKISAHYLKRLLKLLKAQGALQKRPASIRVKLVGRSLKVGAGEIPIILGHDEPLEEEVSAAPLSATVPREVRNEPRPIQNKQTPSKRFDLGTVIYLGGAGLIITMGLLLPLGSSLRNYCALGLILWLVAGLWVHMLSSRQ